MSPRQPAMVVGALVLVAIASSCGAHGAARRAVSTTTTTTTTGPSTSTSVTTSPDARPRCITTTPPEVRHYVGLTLAGARDTAARERRTLRVVGEDGACMLVTMDYSADRVDVELRHGVVVAAQIG